MNRVCANWHWVHNANSSEKGRIIVSWKPSKYQFSTILKTDQLVHGEVYHLPTSKRFYLTIVYGRNYEDQRLPMWGDLRDIASSMDDPWCVLGDFNAVMHMGDRIGGLDVTEGETRDFVTCVSQCGLQEFPHEGSFFTWTNKTIWSRIDRVFHNAVWYDIIDYTHVQFKSPGLSDHTPIILSFPHCPRPRATFQFCDMWVLDKGFREIVKISLSRLSSQNSRHQKLKTLQYFLLALQKPLMKLSRQKFADIFKQQAIARNALLNAQSHLQLDPSNQALHDKEAECRDHYLSINRSAVLLIKQQSKAKWIGLGDECTRVFMARIRQRKALTCIYQIRNQDDLRVEGFDAVSKIMTSYYNHLLGGKLRQRSKIDLQGYHWLQQAGDTPKWSKLVWSRVSIPRHAFTMWLFMQNRLPVLHKLHRYISELPDICPICNQNEETQEHLFFRCPYASNIWTSFCREWGMALHFNDMEAFTSSLCRLGGSRKLRYIKLALISAAIYLIWQARNTKIFKNKETSPQDILQDIKRQITYRFLQLQKHTRGPNACIDFLLQGP
ncbi:hypothetical protein Cgig2_006995 [Carnegiea gigantea]|uniref:Reverse transcriptase zinc-binding domain-containing protein n=1 Tax=Carnegiea gigantea TaxID=171969 RepID=A0A9Q1K9W8_9CARY|nr:hypothetical protein Cgig2_006995 [Carnegiea gigantea]